jgi:predicted DNA-binding transcriptional regulator YafY
VTCPRCAVSESRIEALLLACDEYRHAVGVAMDRADRAEAQRDLVLQDNEQLQARLRDPALLTAATGWVPS